MHYMPCEVDALNHPYGPDRGNGWGHLCTACWDYITEDPYLQFRNSTIGRVCDRCDCVLGAQNPGTTCDACRLLAMPAPKPAACRVPSHSAYDDWDESTREIPVPAAKPKVECPVFKRVISDVTYPDRGTR